MFSNSIILFATALIGIANAGTWCGKPYREPTNSQPEVPNHGVFPALPSWPPADVLAVTPRWKPIYKADQSVEFIVDVPSNALETKIILYFGAGMTHEVPVNTGANIIVVPNTKLRESSAVTALLGSTKANATFMIYKNPVSGTSATVRVDYLHGSLVPEKNRTSPPVFPFGFYVEYEPWMVKDPVGNMKELKDMGVNFVHMVPPYDDRLIPTLKAAEDLGMWMQYDMRHTYKNTSKITAEVNNVKTYEHIVSWYTSDEPDGETRNEPQDSINAYNTIISIDPHRPTMLVLN
ncbi:hypothetical protein BGX27_004918, partial [Mortierella sp. AM989]